MLTWNVHCEDGACAERQVEIANLIVNTGADFVLLNEYNQDNCGIIDSILRKTYLYTEEIHSHQNCGDIFIVKKDCIIQAISISQKRGAMFILSKQRW